MPNSVSYVPIVLIRIINHNTQNWPFPFLQNWFYSIHSFSLRPYGFFHSSPNILKSSVLQTQSHFSCLLSLKTPPLLIFFNHGWIWISLCFIDHTLGHISGQLSYLKYNSLSCYGTLHDAQMAAASQFHI